MLVDCADCGKRVETVQRRSFQGVKYCQPHYMKRYHAAKASTKSKPMAVQPTRKSKATTTSSKATSKAGALTPKPTAAASSREKKPTLKNTPAATSKTKATTNTSKAVVAVLSTPKPTASDRDTDEEMPYYENVPINSASDVPVVNTVVDDVTPPSTSHVDKFGIFKFDQLDLFGDLETKEERAEEYLSRGHYGADIGESILDSGFEYKIARKMGFGNFSLAWLCFETNGTSKKFVALKIYKASNRSTSEEIENHDHIVRYYRSFKIERNGFSHDCAIFEPLGSTLLTLLKRADAIDQNAGLKIPAMKKIIRHLLLGLQHLHDVLGLVHTDIEPENILTNVTERSLFLAVKDVYDSKCDRKGMRAVPLHGKPLTNGLQNVKDDLNKILDNMPLPLSEEPATMTQSRESVSDEVCWDVVRFKLIDLGNAT
uniref:Protein kinase domain-containing protein n=1 Tax=Panagrolaimus sp. ES5 TaxID=591445 RepID=A0AC34G5T9_9BILA